MLDHFNMSQSATPFVPPSEISGAVHNGVASALDTLVSPMLEAKAGDIVAVGSSLVLTPDDILFSDAGLLLYQADGHGRICCSDVLDYLDANHGSEVGSTIKSIHFMMNTDYIFEPNIRMAALELSPFRNASVSLEFIMLKDALLLAKSDLAYAFSSQKDRSEFNGNLGDLVRSLWYAPTGLLDRRSEFYSTKAISAFLKGLLSSHSGKEQPFEVQVPLPEWEELLEVCEYVPSLHTWNVSVS